MSDENKRTATGGIGFLDLLAIVFIVLKLLGKITWSWWWVLAPVWMPVALILGIFLIYLLILAIMAIIALIASR